MTIEKRKFVLVFAFDVYFLQVKAFVGLIQDVSEFKKIHGSSVGLFWRIRLKKYGDLL